VVNLGPLSPGDSLGLTVVVNHDFDIAEDLAVPPVSLFASLDLHITGASFSLEHARRLRVQHERYR
jgi:hypothetical protein